MIRSGGMVCNGKPGYVVVKNGHGGIVTLRLLNPFHHSPSLFSKVMVLIVSINDFMIIVLIFKKMMITIIISEKLQLVVILSEGSWPISTDWCCRVG